ncbi:hypothetical protein ANTRET_LOCUS552 [Anthophora retusa]
MYLPREKENENSSTPVRKKKNFANFVPNFYFFPRLYGSLSIAYYRVRETERKRKRERERDKLVHVIQIERERRNEKHGAEVL